MYLRAQYMYGILYYCSAYLTRFCQKDNVKIQGFSRAIKFFDIFRSFVLFVSKEKLLIFPCT
jgi:hypothetical protein